MTDTMDTNGTGHADGSHQAGSQGQLCEVWTLWTNRVDEKHLKPPDVRKRVDSTTVFLLKHHRHPIS